MILNPNGTAGATACFFSYKNAIAEGALPAKPATGM
jgi:hypothetical protein